MLPVLLSLISVAAPPWAVDCTVTKSESGELVECPEFDVHRGWDGPGSPEDGMVLAAVGTAMYAKSGRSQELRREARDVIGGAKGQVQAFQLGTGEVLYVFRAARADPEGGVLAVECVTTAASERIGLVRCRIPMAHLMEHGVPEDLPRVVSEDLTLEDVLGPLPETLSGCRSDGRGASREITCSDGVVGLTAYPPGLAATTLLSDMQDTIHGYLKGRLAVDKVERGRAGCAVFGAETECSTLSATRRRGPLVGVAMAAVEREKGVVLVMCEGAPVLPVACGLYITRAPAFE